MAGLKYSMMADDWEVLEDGSFISPLKTERPGQAIIFGDRIKNGSLSADITVLESEKRRTGGQAMEASLVVRYSGPEGYYYAGTSAFYSKFFIAKALPGPFFQARQWVGGQESVLLNKTYRLRLDFNGSQLTLFENDVQQLVVLDESYQVGQCGLMAWKTRARFENVRVVRAKPKAFVIMPFTSELNFVHRVIEQTVESYDIDCVRADGIAVSRPIMDDVKSQIAEADLVIVDFTGRNPNVYYEAGLADAWKKDWIVIAQSSDDMTFDVHHIRSIRYSNTMGADQQLEGDLRKALGALGYTRPGSSGTPAKNPAGDEAEGREKRAEPSEPAGPGSMSTASVRPPAHAVERAGGKSPKSRSRTKPRA
jgi:hypothetical protein